jgi:phosphoserine phosphatase
VHDQLAALVLSYSIGTLPELAAVESVAIAFAGHDEHTFEDFVAQAIDRADLASRFHAVVEPIFAWAEERAVPVVVVSASPRTAVAHALARVGLKSSAVLGAQIRVAAGRLVPELERPVLVGNAKVDALRAHTGAKVLAAFGDDVRDLPLLRASRLAVAVHPTKELLARGAETGGLHVLLYSP